MKKFLMILGLSFACLPVWAQETVESVRKEIRAVEEETKREKSLHDAEKKRHAEFVEAGRAKVIALNSQKKAIKAEIDSLKAENARLAEARKKANGTIYWYESKKNKYREQLAAYFLTLVPHLESDYPYQNQEAIESLKELASQLQKGVVSPDDALNRAVEMFTERIRLGYTTEVWKGIFNYETRQIPGTYLRYGAISGVFVSNDGNEVFWLSGHPGTYSWVNVSSDMKMRTLLKEALKVAEGKTAPKLVLLPVSVSEEIQE